MLIEDLKLKQADHLIRSRFTFKPVWHTDVGITIPVNSKTGVTQPSTLGEPRTRVVSGLGDIALDVSRSIGSEGQYSLSFAFGMPTGRYDIWSGSDHKKELHPQNLQLGGGIYSTDISISRVIDGNRKMWIVDAGYSHPIAMHLFSGENSYLDSYFTSYKDSTGSNRFYYRFKPYGENDLGAYAPPSFHTSLYYGDRSSEEYIQSFGLSLAIPLGVAWVADEFFAGESPLYNPRPDPDHKAWSMTLSYGIEFSREQFPLFLSISKQLTDKGDVKGTWNGPDWEQFMYQWTFALGFKASMF
jgi:hypothetical protein